MWGQTWRPIMFSTHEALYYYSYSVLHTFSEYTVAFLCVWFTCADWFVSPVPSKSKTSRVLLDATATASMPAIWSPKKYIKKELRHREMSRNCNHCTTAALWTLRWCFHSVESGDQQNIRKLEQGHGIVIVQPPPYRAHWCAFACAHHNVGKVSMGWILGLPAELTSEQQCSNKSVHKAVKYVLCYASLTERFCISKVQKKMYSG